MSLFEEYLKLGLDDETATLRHLFKTNPVDKNIPLKKVKPISHILQKFGSRAMSFGVISVEAQRDIFLAVKEIGGRCNSGEGGQCNVNF